MMIRERHSRAGVASLVLAAVSAVGLVALLGQLWFTDWSNAIVGLPLASTLLCTAAGVVCAIAGVVKRSRRRAAAVAGMVLHPMLLTAALLMVRLAAPGGLPPRRWATTPAPLRPLQATASVARPTFRVAEASLAAGHVFAVQTSGSPALLVTALHLFGPMGGLKAAVPPSRLPDLVRHVKLAPIERADAHDSELRALSIVEAAPFGTPGRAGDVAAFVAPHMKLPPLALGDMLPGVGDHVWLVARTVDTEAILHHAVVAGKADGVLVYYFDDKLSLQATSGAPVVDANGRVVAINVAGGSDADGAVFGLGNPCTTFGPYIRGRS